MVDISIVQWGLFINLSPGHHLVYIGFVWTWNIMIYIRANYNNSLTWIKAIWGWFPLLTMIPVRSQWGRYNLPRYIDILWYTPISRHFPWRKMRWNQWTTGFLVPYDGPTHMAVCQNLVPLVNIKIAGKWMFIPLKMVLIGIDPYPYRCFIPWVSPTRILGSSNGSPMGWLFSW